MRALLLSLVVLVAACGTPAPRPLALGLDACDQCHMPVSDERFAAQLVTRTGRVLVFDDIACLGEYLETGAMDPAEIAGLWVADFRAPATWLGVDSAAFIATSEQLGPMRGGVMAVPRGAPAESLQVALGGRLLGWDEVRTRRHGAPS